MSLSRTFINEFRPFFRLFDDISRSARTPLPVLARTNLFDDFPRSLLMQPAIDLSEHGNSYIIEAELPGVKKENLEVCVGDNGKSLTIEGKILMKSPPPVSRETQSQDDSTEVIQSSEGPTSLSTEREFSSGAQFSRTIWLPRSVDASKVSGHLEDGILTLRIPKLDEQGSVKVQIE